MNLKINFNKLKKTLFKTYCKDNRKKIVEESGSNKQIQP
mgnify:CR=1 FL=1